MTDAESLALKIRERGYWRVLFRPVSPDDKIDGLTQATKLVNQATVSLRGWDFPHMPSRNADGDSFRRYETHLEASTEWNGHAEFWRFYTSSQFLHYKGIRTDWADRSDLTDPARFPSNVLGVVDNTWHVTETFEFLNRLSLAGLYEHGARVTVALMNTAGRTLYVDESTRSGFYYPRQTNAPSITYESGLLDLEAIQDPKAQSIRALRYIFDKFEWDAPEQMLTEMIDQLYGLNIGRG